MNSRPAYIHREPGLHIQTLSQSPKTKEEGRGGEEEEKEEDACVSLDKHVLPGGKGTGHVPACTINRGL